MMLACITEQLVKLVFGTHYYVWDNTIYHQKQGAPMGLRSSCPASRLLMDFWADTVRDIEEKMEVLHQLNPVQFESIKTHLLIKYVDDVLTVINRIKPGVRWNHITGSLNWSPESEMEDKQKTPEEHTMEVFADLAGGVLKCLEFTWDCPSKCQFWTPKCGLATGRDSGGYQEQLWRMASPYQSEQVH